MADAAVLAAFAAAIAQADTRVGATAPNPPVGCAALDARGELLAVAAHERAGTPHAEPLVLEACRAAGLLPAVATLVVTLEPCNHFGRTPPCTTAIIAAGVRSVWVGAADPNPIVAGGGIAALRDAGIAVTMLEDDADPAARPLAADCTRLIAPFAKRLATGRPWVTIKRALDAAGSMIPPPGYKTFTSEASLAFAHDLRRRSDGVLTGVGTVLADAPEFTVRRVADHLDRRRLLLILDRHGRTPAAYREEAAARGFDVRVAAGIGEALDLAGSLGALSLLAEAGPAVTAALLDGGDWDELVTIRQAAGRGLPDAIERQLRR